MTPLRSVLFVPGSNARAIEKAKTLACDAVILDLEDAVGPEDKLAARAAMSEIVPAGGFAAPLLAVRVNGADTPWAAEDLEAVAAAGPAAVLIPKVASPAELVEARARLGVAPVRLWANIETCLGVLEARAITAIAPDVGLDVVVFGQNDLSRDMGRRPARDRRMLHAAMGLTVLAGRAAGLGLVDGVFNDFGDAEGFEAECREGRAFGFDGKAVIHPSQIEAANRIFAPGEDDLAWARAVIAAFEDPANAGKGAVRVSGGMAERLHLDQARRILASA
jgi:citrate lyase subunit beta/citryl-CoA lyase